MSADERRESRSRGPWARASSRFLRKPFAVLALLVSRYHGLDDRAWDGSPSPFDVTIDSPRDLTERYQLSAIYPLAPDDPGRTELLLPYGAA